MSPIWFVWIMAAGSLIGASEAFAEETRLGIALSLAEYFGVAFCVIGVANEDSGLPLISLRSHPSRKKLLTSVLSFGQISQFMSGDLYRRKGGKTMVVLRAESSSLEYLRQLSRNESLSSAVWVLFSESPFDPELFRDVYVPFDCEFIYIRESNYSFSLTEIYRIERKARMETFDFGGWTEEGGLLLTDVHFYARRNGLKGHKLKAVISNNPPYVSIQRDGDGKATFRGYLYEIWNELEFRLDFRTDFPDEYLDKDVGQVLKSEAVDFALARISIVPSTFDEMDFSQPIHEAKTFMFAQRPGSELDWDSYLKPFSTNTWFVSVVWMLSSSLALAVLYRKAWNSGTSEREANYYIFTFSESVLTVFRAICMQGSDVTPRSNSCRFFFLSIYLTALVVTSAFSAALFSLLTIPKPRSPFNSLDEVLNNNKFKMGFPSDPDFHKLVEDFSSTLALSNQMKLLQRLMAAKGSFPATPLQGLEQICADKFYIFTFDLPEVLYLMQNTTRSCRDKIIAAGPPLFTELIGFGFRKKNPYRGLINFHLIRMKNEGILNRLLLNYWPPEIPTVQATWVRVTLSDISPILYMFALGAALGTAFLYTEKMLLYLKRRKKKKQNPPNFNDRHWLDQKLRPSAYSKNIPPNLKLYYRLNYKH